MITDRLKKTILRQLELDDWEVTDETTASEVPGWDSLSHVKIITAVESEYNIRFQTMEIIRLKNIGQLQSLVDKKVGPG
jgi:acyl carrier protein